MNEQPWCGLNWVLFVVGSLLAIATSIGSLVWDLPWLAALASVGFAAQFLGWRRHARRTGGGA
ncbi:hypothetical protein [Streptomyces sp. NRRL S-920]|uniref:hypothetical protein n=1 Tax=Streptomyces sp. NRRL S-920 TaxID=1463921 RepID=UPI0004C7AB63|nr:hypothetical protein [Streptomyces sp. NRRL S-920]